MVVYSYLVEHDLGLAPNPFGRYCTLTVCKPKIRKSSKLQIGDWVVGTGSKGLEDITGRLLRNKLIYAMEVSEKISFEDYWLDPRFQYKKPIMNGSLISMYGDNFYHKGEDDKWIQEESAHTNLDRTVNKEHLRTDTSGMNALISEHFYYFGDKAPFLPLHLSKVCHTGIGEKKIISPIAEELINWVTSSFTPGRKSDPINWSEYDQLSLF